jgi:hypothetical protein
VSYSQLAATLPPAVLLSDGPVLHSILQAFSSGTSYCEADPNMEARRAPEYLHIALHLCNALREYNTLHPATTLNDTLKAIEKVRFELTEAVITLRVK